jgi:hypothetical protein
MDTQADQKIRASTAQATTRRAFLRGHYVDIRGIHHRFLGWHCRDVPFAHCRAKPMQPKLQPGP